MLDISKSTHNDRAYSSHIDHAHTSNQPLHSLHPLYIERVYLLPCHTLEMSEQQTPLFVVSGGSNIRYQHGVALEFRPSFYVPAIQDKSKRC